MVEFFGGIFFVSKLETLRESSVSRRTTCNYSALKAKRQWQVSRQRTLSSAVPQRKCHENEQEAAVCRWRRYVTLSPFHSWHTFLSEDKRKQNRLFLQSMTLAGDVKPHRQTRIWRTLKSTERPSAGHHKILWLTTDFSFCSLYKEILDLLLVSC